MSNRIYSNRNLIEKLGVKPGQKVGLVGDFSKDFIDQLEGAELSEDYESGGFDLIFCVVSRRYALDGLKELKTYIRPNGAVWVVSAKGKLANVKDEDVIEAAKKAGLVDNKVVSFSETQTALRLVIPVKDR